LPAILDSLPPFLALDLASLADYCKLMNLEAWLRENLKNMQNNVVFASQCLDYLGQKIALESQRQEGNINNLPIPLSLETISTFLKVLSER
jgi:CCR4-NOT transcription complex subunit 1